MSQNVANTRPPAAIEERIGSSIDRTVTGELSVIDTGGGGTLSFGSMGEVLEFSKIMAVAGIAVRKHLRGNPGACAAITMQALRWNMDPFAVANKSYPVNDQIAYESQLIAAVVNTRAPLQERLQCRYEGEGGKRTCIVYGTLAGESAPARFRVLSLKKFSRKTLRFGRPIQISSYSITRPAFGRGALSRKFYSAFTIRKNWPKLAHWRALVTSRRQQHRKSCRNKRQ